MSSVFASRFGKANPKVIWPILTRLPVVAKLGIAGSLGVSVDKTLDAFNVAEDESPTKNDRKSSLTAAAAIATTVVARRLGLIAFAAEKQRGNSGDNDVKYDVNLQRDVIVNVDVIRKNNFNDNNVDVDGGGKSIGKKPVYKYFTNLNEKNIEKPDQRNINSNSDEADGKNNSINNTVNNNSINNTVNNNSINSLDEILALDPNFLVATKASWRKKAEATAKAKLDQDAAWRMHLSVNPSWRVRCNFWDRRSTA